MLCKEQGVTVLAIWILYDVLAITTQYLHSYHLYIDNNNKKNNNNNNDRPMTQSSSILKNSTHHNTNLLSNLSSESERPKSPSDDMSPTSMMSPSVCGWIFEVLQTTVPKHIVTVILLAVALKFRLWMMGNYAPIVFTKAENPASVEKEFIVRSLTFVYLDFYNLFMLIVPYSLCCDWALDSIPLLRSVWDVRLLLPCFFFGVLMYYVHLWSTALVVMCSCSSEEKRIKKQVSFQKTTSETNNKNGNNDSNKQQDGTDGRGDTDGIDGTDDVDSNNAKDGIQDNSNDFKKNKTKGTNHTNDSIDDSSTSSKGEYQKKKKISDELLTVPLLGLFGLLWMCVVFIPAMNIFFYVGFVIAERVLFLPSMGYSLLMACALLQMYHHYDHHHNYGTPHNQSSNRSMDGSMDGSMDRSNDGSKDGSKDGPKGGSTASTSMPDNSTLHHHSSVVVLVVVIVLLYFCKSTKRNLLWRNDVGMMSAEVRTNPNNARLHHGLGVALHSAGRRKEAIHSFQRAWDLWPGYNEPMNFIGVALKEQGDRYGALDAYRLALSKTPAFTKSLFNLASLLTTNYKQNNSIMYDENNQQREKDSREKKVDQITNEQDSDNIDPLNLLNHNVTELEEAMDIYQRLSYCELTSNWERGSVYYQLGSVQLRLGRVWAAALSFERSLFYTKRRHLESLEMLGLLHVANHRIEQGQELHKELWNLFNNGNRNRNENGNAKYQRRRDRLLKRRFFQSMVNIDKDTEIETETKNERMRMVNDVRYELCSGLVRTVLFSWLERGEHLTGDDVEVSFHLNSSTSYEITILENERVDIITYRFCKEREWSQNSSTCTNMLQTLLREERRMRDDSNARGAIRYNLELDNRITVPFQVDLMDYNVTVPPLMEEEGVRLESKRVCMMANMNTEDCTTLEEHVLQLQLTQRTDLMRPLLNWRFNQANTWITVKAEELFLMLESDRTSSSSSEETEKRVRKRQLRRLSFLKDHYGFPLLAQVYKRASLHEQHLYESTKSYIHMKRWLHYERSSAIFIAESVVNTGEKNTLEMWNLNWNTQISELMNVNIIAQQYNQHQKQIERGVINDQSSQDPHPTRGKKLNVKKVLHDALQETTERGNRKRQRKKQNVTIVSLCQYDPSVTPLAMLSIQNKMKYSQRHGYDLYVETYTDFKDRPPAWSKVQIMMKYMKSPFMYDWVVWMDCDTLIMNMSVPLEILFTKTILGTSIDQTEHDLLNDEEMEGEEDEVQMILTEDGNMLNTGKTFTTTKNIYPHRTIILSYN